MLSARPFSMRVFVLVLVLCACRLPLRCGNPKKPRISLTQAARRISTRKRSSSWDQGPKKNQREAKPAMRPGEKAAEETVTRLDEEQPTWPSWLLLPRERWPAALDPNYRPPSHQLTNQRFRSKKKWDNKMTHHWHCDCWVGTLPSNSGKWRFSSGSPPKNACILVVTIAGKGGQPNLYNWKPKSCDNGDTVDGWNPAPIDR